MKNKLSIKQRFKACFILLVSGSLVSEVNINDAANDHFKPIDGNIWTHNNSFKEGARWVINRMVDNDR